MARQGPSGIITGGQLDPYVASRMAMDKQAQQNRILESMRQSGEDRRQSESIGASQRMQTERLAAQSAENDKMLADRARSAREDRAFKNAQRERQEAHRVELENLAHGHAKELLGDRLDVAKGIAKDFDRTVAWGQATAAQDRFLNRRLLEKFFDMQGKVQQGREALAEKSIEETTKAERFLETATRFRSNAEAQLSTSSDFNVKGQAVDLTDPLTHAKFSLSPFSYLIDNQDSTYLSAAWEQVNNLLNEYAPSNDLKSFDLLSEDKTEDFFRTIESGSVDSVDIAAAYPVLQGALDAVDKKLQGESLTERDKKLWGKLRASIDHKRIYLETKATDTTPIPGRNDGVTYGSVIRHGIDLATGGGGAERGARLSKEWPRLDPQGIMAPPEGGAPPVLNFMDSRWMEDPDIIQRSTDHDRRMRELLGLDPLSDPGSSVTINPNQ